MSPFLWSFLVTLAFSAISFISIYLVSALRKHPFIPVLLISVAVGALLGDAFFHLLPEALESSSASVALNFVLFGLILFFIFERFVLWRHCHQVDCPDEHQSSPSSVPVVNLAGDLVHNFMDGLIIAASFAASIPLGISTSIAVALHEIPQEIGDSAILMHYGYSRSRSLMLNLVASASAILAVILFFVFGLHNSIPLWVAPLIAGGFIYLACSDLIPELRRHHPALNNTLLQLLGLTFGIFLMYLLTVLE
jgi:zinc and cadmium transporter